MACVRFRDLDLGREGGVCEFQGSERRCRIQGPRLGIEGGRCEVQGPGLGDRSDRCKSRGPDLMERRWQV